MNTANSTTVMLPSRRAAGRGFDLTALGALFVLTLRQDLRGRRLLVLSLLFLLPSVLVMMVPLFGHAPPPEHLEFAFVFNLIPHALATLTALLYATGIIQDEIEDQTLTYLLVRPLPRWALYLTKLIVTVGVTSALTGLFTILALVVLYWGTDNLIGEVLPWRALKIVGLMTVAQVSYCTLFGAMSLVVRRAVVAGLIYIIVIEGVLNTFASVLQLLTVNYYFRVLVVRWLDPPDSRAWALTLDTAPSAARCVLILLAASAVFAILGAVLTMRKEFRVKTPEGS
jgi:ABC-2 type transport system permease protein